ncbi:hypothetical protein ACG-M12_0003 [Escherichia phage vB_EcoS_ACG-M12]|uniref:Uncharacterized protein n=3 Tax=Braunvirinae TaxID=2732045 RepID=K4FBS0_9CAUD|nr:hypothetical protein D861_gp76 [Escherichia phage vB_EcoS_ACG-M12]AFH19884.1 hypothetical protein ACG-M12_0003 [Escherichia phage vB_EcoS_ACG-M12]UOX39679.1 hypothetical protein [Escherichia phage vB_EcoS_SCS31]
MEGVWHNSFIEMREGFKMYYDVIAVCLVAIVAIVAIVKITEKK